MVKRMVIATFTVLAGLILLNSAKAEEKAGLTSGVEIGVAVERLSKGLSQNVAKEMEIVILDFTGPEKNVGKIGKFLAGALSDKLSVTAQYLVENGYCHKDIKNITY